MEARSSALRTVPRLRFTRSGLFNPDLGLVAAAALVAAALGYELSGGHRTLILAFSVLPLVAVLLTRPTVPLVLLGASIPFVRSLTGHDAGGGRNVSLSDLLLLLVGGGILLQMMSSRTAPAVRALRPVALPVLVYGAFMVILLPAHASVGEVLKTGQRAELFLLPLVVGAFAVLTGRHIRLLQAYVLATSLLAVVFPLASLGMQKNPVGQMIANAILLLVGVSSLRRLFPCLVLLVPGLLLTQSRGAIAAAVIGTAVIMGMQALNLRSLATRVLPLVVVAAGAFYFLPTATQQRVTTFSASTNTRAGYSIYFRQQYSNDALRIIRAHPWTGIGVGNYLAGDPSQGTQASDPHEVILLQAAEGGYGLAVCFVVLIVGSLVALVRLRKVSLAPAAAGVLAATVAHGFVDVYWVRGTPVLGWLLVGMVCGLLATSRLTTATSP
jgi:O-antigen ligase